MLLARENKQYVSSGGWVEGVLIVFSLVCTICILWWLIKYSHYGVDFTDESFYLVWISNPYIYDWSLSQFGFIYHPLYMLFNGDIPALRQANILLTFGLSSILVNVFIGTIVPGQLGWISRLALSSGFATICFAFLGPWLPTPSYNSLTLQALLITATGMLLAEVSIIRPSVLGWVLIGLGGWLAFMAKPSTAAALGACVFLYVLFARKLNIKLMIVSGGTALLLLLMSVIVVDGSVAKFADRLSVAATFVDYLGGGHTLGQILRVDSFTLNDQEKFILLFVIIVSSLSAIFCCYDRLLFKGIGLMLSAFFVVLTLVDVLGIVNSSLDYSNFHGLLIMAIPLAAVLVGLVRYRQAFFCIMSSRWALMAAFIVFPHVYAFGTNGNYWQVAGAAGIFWVLAGLLFLASVPREPGGLIVLFPLLLATQTIAAVLVKTGMETPYRQAEALRLNDYSIDIGKSGSTLLVSQGYGSYLSQVKNSARSVGFQKDTPVIDLTGQSAGVLYALQAINIGQAWTIGGYPGSLKLAEEALKRVPCDQIADAWLLSEPDGPRSISNELLSSFGAGHPSDYEVVASWSTAVGAGGYQERPMQKLLKPARDRGKAALACMEARAVRAK